MSRLETLARSESLLLQGKHSPLLCTTQNCVYISLSAGQALHDDSSSSESSCARIE